MLELIYSPESESDLIEAWIYIAEDRHPETADKALASVFDKCNVLLKQPELGRRPEELFAGLRSIPQGSYVVFTSLLGTGLKS